MTDATRPSTSDDADFGTLLDAHTIRFVRDLPGPIERVWAYLTESDLKAKWIGPGDVPAEIGGERTMTWNDENGEIAGGLTLRTRVFDPPHVLEYDWVELQPQGRPSRDSVVRVELAAHGDGVRLTLTHRALPVDSYETIGAGWHAHLDTLRAAMNGIEGPDAEARYEAVRERYAALAPNP
ncbi:MAG TPA: SRPBCC family protein [Candidatus Baltobacteraceae bacterium]|nr:SRPBCC family protein [Candidatus Baltobacteraceae bacterium]